MDTFWTPVESGSEELATRPHSGFSLDGKVLVDAGDRDVFNAMM